MPKRKAAPTKLSGLIGSDDEDLMQVDGTQERHENERPAKKARGRPRSKSAEHRIAQSDKETAAPQPPEPTTRRTTRRGRPKGSRNSVPAEPETAEQQDDAHETEDNAGPEVTENPPVSNDELDAPQNVPKPKKSAKPAKAAGTRGRGRKISVDKQIKTDGEFEYTPTISRQVKSPERRKEPTEQPKKSRRKAQPEPEPEPEPVPEAEAENDDDEGVPETQHEVAADVIEETMVQEEPVERRRISVSPMKRRQSNQRYLLSSPAKRRAGGAVDEDRNTVEIELRRRVGDLTKKNEALENRYRNLKEIGVVEANANVEKIRKQCESIQTASDKYIATLKGELEAQRVLGQQSRALQKQLNERDVEAAQLKTQADEASAQLSSAQTEVKALQTKLAAARNTAASLESAATKIPGSAIKGGGANRANAAVSAEAANAAQFAQLKEDLYSDLTGLIIRDVKKREKDNLYDCIQTGINGTLHFKLVVPHVSSANFENAEFQYIPLLDENRDRELVDILPEYLTVDITFVRQQASKFYTRVIDALTKRRSSTTN